MDPIVDDVAFLLDRKKAVRPIHFKRLAVQTDGTTGDFGVQAGNVIEKVGNR